MSDLPPRPNRPRGPPPPPPSSGRGRASGRGVRPPPQGVAPLPARARPPPPRHVAPPLETRPVTSHPSGPPSVASTDIALNIGLGRGSKPRTQPDNEPSSFSSGQSGGSTTLASVTQQMSETTLPSSGEEKTSSTLQDLPKSGSPHTSTEEAKRKGPLYYRGQTGKDLKVATNYLKLSVAEDKGVFEYEVVFDPRIDSRDQRFRLLNQLREITGPTKSFDGTKLFLPKKLEPPEQSSFSDRPENGDKVKVTLKFKSARKSGDRDVVQHFNILFNKIFRILKFSQHNRNFYDAAGAHAIKAYNLSVWPGYVTAVDQYEGGLLLQIDVHHRVLRTETVRDFLLTLAKRGGDMKAEADKHLLGTSVLTRYNNKSYKIDEMDFNASPKDTFTNEKGESMTYLDYYRNQYGITIRDQDQPLILHRPKKKSVSEEEANKIICLIPELCMLTGMTDAMRADFKIMKEVAVFTRVTPEARRQSMASFVKRINSSEEAKTVLANWGLTIEPEPVLMSARQLPPERLIFGRNYSEMVNPKGDWGRTATTRPCLTAIALTKWACVFPEKSKRPVQEFVKVMTQQASKMGIQIAMPKVVGLPNDRTETYLKEMRDLIDPSVQMIVTIVPQMKSDRYAGIKKLCCLEKPVPSQVIVLKTISNEKRLSSVAQKVALQINCKLGGELWACQTPFKDLMVVGIDVFHDKSLKSGSIAGVVTSVNDHLSRYYSTVAIQRQGQEIVDALKIAFMDALIKYWEINSRFPANIVVYRDGVGDGQMEVTKSHEVAQFLSTFKHVKSPAPGPSNAAVRQKHEILAKNLPEGYNPGFNFVVVQKRINTRIFGGQKRPAGGMEYINPPAGTIVDHMVTRHSFKDFFLVPQSVSQGTVAPTHFVVLEESGRAHLEADKLQQLSYKLTHMYFNWPGTVRVPAPCQYAHKLVDLVGEQLHAMPSPELNSKLYYL